MVKVSILLPVYNNKDDIVNAIQSVIDQTYKDWELIIIDDCSTDGTKELIKQYNKCNFVFIENIKNVGVYSSLNNGLLRAKGEYIARIDSDDRYISTFLEKSINILDTHPQIMMVKSLYQREGGRPVCGEITSVYRKAVIDKIGYYDSIRFGADTEFDYRFKKVFGNHKIYKLNEVTYHAKRREGSLTTSKITGIATNAAASIRKDYMQNASKWHNSTAKSYMPYPLIERPFPVHERMLP